MQIRWRSSFSKAFCLSCTVSPNLWVDSDNLRLFLTQNTGDCVEDEKQDYAILSGDLIIEELARQFKSKARALSTTLPVA